MTNFLGTPITDPIIRPPAAPFGPGILNLGGADYDWEPVYTPVTVGEAIDAVATATVVVPAGMVARGSINITARGLAHVVARHTAGGTRTAGKSIFGAGEDVASLVSNAASVQRVPQAGGNFQRVIDAGRSIGIDRATGQPTSVYTVITNAADDLITTFPGVP